MSPAVENAAARENRWKAVGRSRPTASAASWGFGKPVAGSSCSSGSRSASSGTRRLSTASSARDSAPGTASSAKPGHSAPVSAAIPASSSGPENAPTWSSALCRAKPRPRPVGFAIRARRADFAGLRTALPVRSSRISPTATARPAPPRNGVTASSGTHTAVIAYPSTVSRQWRWLRSAQGPVIRRSTSAIPSPAPVTRPTVSADAPSVPRKGPAMARMPS